MRKVTVVGAGLAGCEAAYQLHRQGISVRLIEMKPHKMTPAHSSPYFAELVCSNSLRGDELSTGPGLLKEELRRLGSLILSCADETRVAAGGALAVDREAFAQRVTEKIQNCQHIEVVAMEAAEIPEGEVIIATGPLTTDAMAAQIATLCPESRFLNFYDAAAPIVTAQSIDMEKAYFGSRYDKGTPDYINCPMNRDEYLAFYEALITAREAAVHGFDDGGVFEGCMPIEVMARRGEDTMRFGPLKPVGLPDPRTGGESYAVVQLRRDNAAGSLYNLVGFQTHLAFPEQKRVFSMIPGLEQAEFVRYGVMHRNTFIDSPRLLNQHYQLRSDPRIFFAGQITGVEGYIESTASGFVAGVAAARQAQDRSPIVFPRETAIGALSHYISDASIVNFQPMNINFGIIEPLGYRVKGKRNKNLALSQRALELIQEIPISDEI